MRVMKTKRKSFEKKGSKALIRNKTGCEMRSMWDSWVRLKAAAYKKAHIYFKFVNFLISKCEDDIDEEENSVENGQSTLGHAEILSVARCPADQLPCRRIVPELDDQGTGCDEHSAADQREENI